MNSVISVLLAKYLLQPLAKLNFLNNVGDFWCLDCIKCESCILYTVSHLQEPSINIKKGKVYMYFLTNYKRTCNLWTLFFKLRKVLYLKQKLCNDPNNSTWTWQQHDNKLCNHIQIYCVPFSSVLLIISTDDTVPKVLKRSLKNEQIIHQMSPLQNCAKV